METTKNNEIFQKIERLWNSGMSPEFVWQMQVHNSHHLSMKMEDKANGVIIFDLEVTSTTFMLKASELKLYYDRSYPEQDMMQGLENLFIQAREQALDQQDFSLAKLISLAQAALGYNDSALNDLKKGGGQEHICTTKYHKYRDMDDFGYHRMRGLWLSVVECQTPSWLADKLQPRYLI